MASCSLVLIQPQELVMVTDKHQAQQAHRASIVGGQGFALMNGRQPALQTPATGPPPLPYKPTIFEANSS